MPPKINANKLSKSNEMFNFYEHKEVKKLMDDVHNPCFDVHQLEIPFRLGIIGSSGSGKTSILLNLLSQAQDTFSYI